MPVLTNPFYHKTISLLTGVFGSVFDQIQIVRQDGKTILVPIEYEIKQRYNVRNEQNPDPNTARYKMTLPRMGFKLTGMQRDDSRVLNKFTNLTEQGVDRETAQGLKRQYNRVPYIFQYRLDVKTKNLDDMLQIMEQIMVYFNPALRVTVKDNPDLNQDTSVTIKMLSAGIEDMFEGAFDGEQVLESSLDFELEGYLYMPTQDTGIIKQITINYYDLDLDAINQSELLETDTVLPE